MTLPLVRALVPEDVRYADRESAQAFGQGALGI